MRLAWDEDTKRLYETGTRKGVLYPMGTTGAYENGVAWNGLTAVTESPSGAEETALYADDVKYLSMRSKEEFGGTIEAYTYPDEWAECDGSAQLAGAPGVMVGQQTRKKFGLCYRTAIGNDVEADDYGYKLHLVYGAQASPSERSYATINDSPEAITFSWEFTTTPKDYDGDNLGLKPTAIVTIDSTKVSGATAAEREAVMKRLEDVLYGTETNEPRLPLPSELAGIMYPGSVTYTVTYNANGGTGTITPVSVTAGESITLNDGTGLTSPEGKEFLGWAKSSTAQTPTVNSPFKPTGDTALYAVWGDL